MSAIGRRKIKALIGGQLLFIGIFAAPAINANDFTAEKVMKQLDAKERYVYLAGVVEGLAIARYMKDGKQKTGMECIYGWFYDDKKTVDLISAAFEKYPSFPPGSVVDVLVKRKCGE